MSSPVRVNRLRRAITGLTLLCLALAAASGITYLSIPTGNTQASHFDTLIVLGYPSQKDGSPSLWQRSRVREAVSEYRAGRASHLIMTGGAAHNRFVEAEAMARLATDAGVPASALVVEGKARNTIENIYFSHQIMQQRGWTSAEIVSSPAHLPRAALILGYYRVAWRTHAAPWPAEAGLPAILAIRTYELLGTSLLRWTGMRWLSPYLPPSPPSG